MGLSIKFNLVLLFTFALGLSVAAYFAHWMLQRNAKEEVLHDAGLMMESAMAIREYTVTEISPLLTLQMKRQFLPQSVPAYAATTNIQNLRQEYPAYSYKEATLNPTNPADRATDWEADLIEWFRNHPEERQIVGQRQAATGPTLYLARPIQITDPDCLTCHDTPQRAPDTLIAKYGDSNGFGWKLNEIVGAQVVTVPMSVPFERANRAFLTFVSGLAGAFLLVAIVMNIFLHFIVIRPVNRIARVANAVSRGDETVPEVSVGGNDQIASLAASFNRMRRSLGSAMQMLEDSFHEEEQADRSRHDRSSDR
jgi:protein-histidine pros-kinase